MNKKLHSGQTSVQKSQGMTAGQPPMEMMQKIQAMKDAWKENPKDFNTNIQLANAYFDISRFEKAAFYYNNANAAKPDQPNILIDLGVSYFNISKPDSAIQFVEQALKIQPDHVFGLYNAGIIYYNLNKVDAAIAVWKKLISKHSGSREAQAAQEFIKQIENQQSKS